jgi:protoporphyrinogen/coproporphyrinogen III oxidase
MTADSPVRSVAVVGGGCTGLAAAHRLQELAPDIGVTLFEAGPRLGGALQTERSDGYLIEYGADMFTTKEPWARDLCRRIGFEQELIGTNTEHARAFVIRRGKLYPVPEGFALMTPGKAWPILRTPLLGIGGKLRMGWEYFVPARKEVSDESLAEFAIRRLGREAYERLVQPLIAGIYTADPTQLSMQAALPQFVEMERQHGGLLRALRRHRGPRGSAPSAAGARYGLFLAPRHGMQSLMERLAGTLTTTTFRIKTPVVSLDRHDDGSWGVGSANSPPIWWKRSMRSWRPSCEPSPMHRRRS